MSAPRVRFAPAPTGFLHVGSARAALFNWMFARHTGGTFVLRIEDTDPARSRDELVEGIERTLHWLGLDWDEGPYRQSTRMHLYAEAAARLLAEGRAYWCDCSREAIDARTPPGAPPGYDGFCRERGLERSAETALRLHLPDEGETVVHDLIRGDVHFDHATLEDVVIQRRDGTPTFLLANAVDDADMAISHVIRGEDLLPSTPKVLLLRQALGNLEVPIFAHLPLLVDDKRAKLSKRRHAIAVEDYRDQGYLPEALRNYLALLGWAPPDGREIVPLDEMVEAFEVEAVNKAPAFFDTVKLAHVNARYLRALPVATFVRESLPWLMQDPPWPPERLDPAVFEAVAPLVQERVQTLGEVPAMVDFLFLEEPCIDDESWAKAVTGLPEAGAVLDDAIAAFESCPWEAEAIHQATSDVAVGHGLKLAKAQAPIRVAVTGRRVGPPLFESLQALGRAPTLERLRAARRRWASEQSPTPSP
ncbi:MAG TPA: glutamate--tRNA ligase [Acidimicrobiales bacterium]|nr:glutamate--tRNA ligase [Acidimicrobiales bacterium]